MNQKPIPRGGIISTSFQLPFTLRNRYPPRSDLAYCALAFEEGIEAYKDFVGLSAEYVKKEKKSTVALEAHVTYLNKITDYSVRILTRILNFDGKKVHIYQELFMGKLLLARQETLSISFDINTRRSCQFDEPISERYQMLHDAQKELDPPIFSGLSLNRLTKEKR